jgi:hypothetical protein
MLELMNDLALELNESRRRELALDEMRAARASGGGLRRSAAHALVAAGEWLSGDLVAPDRQSSSPAPKMQVSGDCV